MIKKKIIGFGAYVICGLGAMFLASKLKEYHDIVLFISGYFTCKICQAIEE